VRAAKIGAPLAAAGEAGAGAGTGKRIPALGASAAAGPRLAAEAAHEFLENVLRREPACRRAAGAPASGCRTAPEAGEAGIAVGIDLAAVILRPPLRIRKEVIGP